MCPAYAKKAGIERKKWAKFVPISVEQVQIGTGMGFGRAAWSSGVGRRLYGDGA